MTLHPIFLNFLIYMRKILFYFLSVYRVKKYSKHLKINCEVLNYLLIKFSRPSPPPSVWSIPLKIEE
jgi:hypothetical protein